MRISPFPKHKYVFSLPLTNSRQASVPDQVLWVLKKAGISAKDHVTYYVDNPTEGLRDLRDWVKDNKVTCALIIGGVLVIVVPVAIGFGPAGPILGILPPPPPP